WFGPGLQLGVEVAAGVTLPAGVDAGGAECGEPLVDQLRNLLKGRGPVTVTAAEYGELSAPLRARCGGDPVVKFLGVVRRRPVVGRRGDQDRAVGRQRVHPL